jgi:hypothetical protein
MYNEDNQEEACKLMIEAGFPMGRMIHPIDESTIPNAVASTEEDGPFWYGDMEYMDAPKMVDVARKIGKEITIKSTTSDSLSAVMRFNVHG